MIRDAELFPDELLKAAAIGRIAPGHGGEPFVQGRHRSHRQGDSAEFEDFRSYAPGDDLRRVDWHIFRRFRKLLIRRYREFPQQKHLIVLDDSRSIRFRAARKRLVWRLAALIAGSLLCGGDRAALRIGGRTGRFLPPGADSLAPLLGELQQAYRKNAPGEAPDYAVPRDVHAWIISDFMDPAGLDHLEETLRRSRGFTPVRIFEADELTPSFTTETRLIDAETGAEAFFSPTAAALEAYRNRLHRFEKLLEIPAARSGGRVYAFDAGSDVGALLKQCARKLFAAGAV